MLEYKLTAPCSIPIKEDEYFHTFSFLKSSSDTVGEDRYNIFVTGKDRLFWKEPSKFHKLDAPSSNREYSSKRDFDNSFPGSVIVERLARDEYSITLYREKNDSQIRIALVLPARIKLRCKRGIILGSPSEDLDTAIPRD